MQTEKENGYLPCPGLFSDSGSLAERGRDSADRTVISGGQHCTKCWVGGKLESGVLCLGALEFFYDPACTLNISCSLGFPCKCICCAAVQAEQTLDGCIASRL